jgi:hypothetical protein
VGFPPSHVSKLQARQQTAPQRGIHTITTEDVVVTVENY